MNIKEVSANIVLDSRGEETIQVVVNGCATSAPAGKSKGKHEKPSYKKSLKTDCEVIKHLKLGEMDLRKFEHLQFVEDKVKKNIGANTLFALEASILKALAQEKGIELWKFLNPDAKNFPKIISNTIGGGAHSHAKINPDFQEFLVTCNKNPSIARVVNKNCHDEAYAILKGLTLRELRVNDENAWQTDLDNERVIEVMKEVTEDVLEETGVHVDVGLDIAASQFFKKNKYVYMNRNWARTRQEQIDYITGLCEKYNLFYIEDPLDEEDFEGFAELVRKVHCLVVGDDLTTTNFERTKKAIEMNAITGIIIKPNQIGSLLEVKKIIDLCKKRGVRTIISHRSGETLDDTIADLGFAWQVDFIKTPVVGPERIAKVNRLIEIEKRLR